MQFCLGVIPQTATGCHPLPHIICLCIFFYLKCIHFSLIIAPISKYGNMEFWEYPNMKSWESDLSNDMYFVKIIKVVIL